MIRALMFIQVKLIHCFSVVMVLSFHPPSVFCAKELVYKPKYRKTKQNP